MAEQLTAVAGEFGSYLDGLLSRLDQNAGWCGVFWHRDPDGMRACREGREVPPWDVVDALLRDLAAAYGTVPALAERERARALHAAALVAYDARPGARETLDRRLHATLRERHDADEREAALAQRLAEARTEAEAEALRVDLAWARDARHRATARCAELRDRLSRMARSEPSAARVPGQGAPGRTPRADASALAPGAPAEGAEYAASGRAHYAATPDFAPGGRADAAARASGQAASGRTPHAATSDFAPGAPADARPAASGDHPTEAPSKPRKRRRGSARFAGLDDETPAPLILPGAPPDTPDLRGARFAGAEAEIEGEEAATPVPHPDDHRAVAQAVAHLAALRAGGRSGEAYTLLAEAARWPAVRLPLLADALTHADWTTLRWEAAALPPEQLLAAVQALTASDRPEEAHRLLREGAARPPEETGAAVARLQEEGRTRDARTLLDASLRTRTPEDAARLATPDPDRLTPLLLEAARHVSEDHHRALLHALRAAGITP
ncbi:hypothetical protein E5083_14970 [Streptomyces bauhiniae]|uniref:UL36 very large tegument protein n=1 Tax=Streptomyces bauhiniae TaxID=2340725 RepID=A0A4Z1D345_9ACTN|nr:hypothetical protein [Streptomyces bauhiniae]TGN76490.1 hypothetical protein E5083_14970 [Streptomyces bauhiniae]